jgi:hypothetical protein
LTAQALAHEPPQSTSLSLPAVSTPSLHVVAAQSRVVRLQSPEAQSPLTVQATPVAHRAAQVAPPQSTPVSAPLRVRSRQASVEHTEPTQRFEAQSVGAAQDRPFAHGLPHEPPQSTSASVASLTSFSQGPPTQRPLVQVLVTQSALPVQAFETAHLRHVGPPQSMLDSEPFLMPSLQPGAVQVPVRRLQMLPA